MAEDSALEDQAALTQQLVEQMPEIKIELDWLRRQQLTQPIASSGPSTKLNIRHMLT